MGRPTQAEALQMHKDALKVTEEERYDHGEQESGDQTVESDVTEYPSLDALKQKAEEDFPTEEPTYIKGEALPAPPPSRRDRTHTGYQIVPKGTRMLIWVDESDEYVSPGGIVLPKAAREEDELEEGVVVAIGQGRYNADQGRFLGCNYQVGDRVWFRRTAPHLLTEIPGQKGLLLIQEDLCQAVLLKPAGDQADDETESEESDERPDHGGSLPEAGPGGDA